MSETCHIGVPEVDLLEARPCADIAAASDRPALAVAHNNLTCGITTFQEQPRASQPEPRSSSQKSPAPRRRPGAAAPPGLTPKLFGAGCATPAGPAPSEPRLLPVGAPALVPQPDFRPPLRDRRPLVWRGSLRLARRLLPALSLLPHPAPHTALRRGRGSRGGGGRKLRRLRQLALRRERRSLPPPPRRLSRRHPAAGGRRRASSARRPPTPPRGATAASRTSGSSTSRARTASCDGSSTARAAQHEHAHAHAS